MSDVGSLPEEVVVVVGKGEMRIACRALWATRIERDETRIDAGTDTGARSR